MRPREYGLIILAIVVAAICIRLGFWQLDRRQQRRIHNAEVAVRLSAAPLPVQQLPRDTAALRYREATVVGVYDYDHQVTLTSRTRNGSPGVNILTPVRLLDSDSAVLVNRGWVYAPDGMTADLTSWREADSARVTGYAVPFDVPRTEEARSPNRPRAYRWVTPDVLREAIPYPLLPFIIVQRSDTIPGNGIPPRIPMPTLDEGPHLSYAIQWFSFAAIGVIGAVMFARAGMRRRERETNEG